MVNCRTRQAAACRANQGRAVARSPSSDAPATRIQGAKGSQMRSTSPLDRPLRAATMTASTAGPTSVHNLRSRSLAIATKAAGPRITANAPRSISQKADWGRNWAALARYWIKVAWKPSSYQKPATANPATTAITPIAATANGRHLPLAIATAVGIRATRVTP